MLFKKKIWGVSFTPPPPPPMWNRFNEVLVCIYQSIYLYIYLSIYLSSQPKMERKPLRTEWCLDEGGVQSSGSSQPQESSKFIK